MLRRPSVQPQSSRSQGDNPSGSSSSPTGSSSRNRTPISEYDYHLRRLELENKRRLVMGRLAQEDQHHRSRDHRELLDLEKQMRRLDREWTAAVTAAQEEWEYAAGGQEYAAGGQGYTAEGAGGGR